MCDTLHYIEETVKIYEILANSLCKPKIYIRILLTTCMAGRPKKQFQRIFRPIMVEMDGVFYPIIEKLPIKCPICGSENIRENGTQGRKEKRIEGFQCLNPDCTFISKHTQGKQFTITSSLAFSQVTNNIVHSIYRKLGCATCSHSEIARDYAISEGLVSYMHKKMIQTYERFHLLESLVETPQDDTAIAIDETFLKIHGISYYVILAVGYSSRKVLGIRVSRTRTSDDMRAVFDEAEVNTKHPITVVTADAWMGTRKMIKHLNRPITFVIHKHKTPYNKAILFEIEYSDQERITTKIGMRTDFFRWQKKREFFYKVEREPIVPKRYSIKGRPPGRKNGQGQKPKFKKKNVPRGPKGLFAVFTKGKRGYAKIYPCRKRVKVGGDVPPAVAAAFGRTIELFPHKFIQNNLAENLNSVLSFHLNLSGPKTAESLEKRIRGFLLVYNHPERIQMLLLRHNFQQSFLFSQLKSNPFLPLMRG